MKTNNGILVTGSHRSGSTWVGRMIALSPQVGYIHEPFNVRSGRPGKLNTEIKYWYHSVIDSDESEFYQAFQRTLNFEYSLFEEIKVIRSWRDIIRMFRDYSQFRWNNLTGSIPLIKDPLALFSTDWLVRHFHLKPVILIRHPAAFVGSLKKKGWYFDFSNFLNQPCLLEEKLYPFRADIEEYSSRKVDLIEQGSLLWKLIHYLIYTYQQQYPKWLFLKYEDIANDPIKSFKTIYQYLGLEFTDSIEKKILYYSHSNNPKEPSDVNSNFPRIFKRYKHKITRDSAANLNTWRERLTPSEIEIIKSSVKEISPLFYNEEDW